MKKLLLALLSICLFTSCCEESNNISEKNCVEIRVITPEQDTLYFVGGKIDFNIVTGDYRILRTTFYKNTNVDSKR